PARFRKPTGDSRARAPSRARYASAMRPNVGASDDLPPGGFFSRSSGRENSETRASAAAPQNHEVHRARPSHAMAARVESQAGDRSALKRNATYGICGA